MPSKTLKKSVYVDNATHKELYILRAEMGLNSAGSVIKKLLEEHKKKKL